MIYCIYVCICVYLYILTKHLQGLFTVSFKITLPKHLKPLQLYTSLFTSPSSPFSLRCCWLKPTHFISQDNKPLHNMDPSNLQCERYQLTSQTFSKYTIAQKRYSRYHLFQETHLLLNKTPTCDRHWIIISGRNIFPQME